jgi:RNA polymerase sigma-70 factor (ECF subfamily)
VTHAARVADRLFRREAGRAVATLARTTRDLALAEEAVQAAFAVAVERWPADGVPDDPAAWIYVTARNRALDELRRRSRTADVAALEALPAPERAAEPWPDDRLALVFACCHPALAPEARIALTLRHVGGLTTAEVARAFLASEAAMAQRLVRARQKLRAARIAIEVPERDAMPERLAAVLTTLYLIFTEGYAGNRRELTAEAIRLARLLAVLAPGEPEARALVALLALQDSRRDARFAPDGTPVLLADQDRAQWDSAQIAEARRLLRGAGRGRYALQARIAAEHASGETDWRAVAGLYRELYALDPSPVVRLNGAVAVAEAHGPEAGLVAVEAAGEHGALDDYHLFHSTRAEVLRRLGRRAEARAAYARARELAPTEHERAFLDARLRLVEEDAGVEDPGGVDRLLRRP